MKIQNIRTLPGPNVYSHQPVLVMTLDLEDLTGKESYEVLGFIDRLLARVPGVHDHHCALGRPGGFIERLKEGTYFGHIVEHVALELTDPVGISTYRGKTVSAGVPGRYLVAVTYKGERAIKFLLQVAVELVQSLVDDQPYPLEEKLEEARHLVAKYELGPSTKAIVTAAERRGIPWTRADENSLVRLGMGKHSEYIREFGVPGAPSGLCDWLRGCACRGWPEHHLYQCGGGAIADDVCFGVMLHVLTQGGPVRPHEPAAEQ